MAEGSAKQQGAYHNLTDFRAFAVGTFFTPWAQTGGSADGEGVVGRGKNYSSAITGFNILRNFYRYNLTPAYFSFLGGPARGDTVVPCHRKKNTKPGKRGLGPTSERKQFLTGGGGLILNGKKHHPGEKDGGGAEQSKVKSPRSSAGGGKGSAGGDTWLVSGGTNTGIGAGGPTHRQSDDSQPAAKKTRRFLRYSGTGK